MNRPKIPHACFLVMGRNANLSQRPTSVARLDAKERTPRFHAEKDNFLPNHRMSAVVSNTLLTLIMAPAAHGALYRELAVPLTRTLPCPMT